LWVALACLEVDLGGQLEGAPEASGLALAAVERHVPGVTGYSILRSPVSVTVEPSSETLDVLGRDAGELGGQDITFLGLVEVHEPDRPRACPGRRRHAGGQRVGWQNADRAAGPSISPCQGFRAEGRVSV
jgi:hypothetical protein